MLIWLVFCVHSCMCCQQFKWNVSGHTACQWSRVNGVCSSFFSAVSRTFSIQLCFSFGRSAYLSTTMWFLPRADSDKRLPGKTFFDFEVVRNDTLLVAVFFSRAFLHSFINASLCCSCSLCYGFVFLANPLSVLVIWKRAVVFLHLDKKTACSVAVDALI